MLGRVAFGLGVAAATCACGTLLALTGDDDGDPSPTAGGDASDGATTADGGSTAFACDARFCSDFDPEGLGPELGWTAIRTARPNAAFSFFGRQPQTHRSPPYAFRVATKGTEASDEKWLVKSIDAPELATMRFVFRRASAEWAPDASVSGHFLVVRCTEDLDAFQVKVRNWGGVAPNGGIELKSHNGPDQLVLDSPLPFDAWIEMRLELVRLPGAASDAGLEYLARFAVVGPGVSSPTIEAPPVACTPPLTVQIGARPFLGVGDYDFLFDDVALDWTD